MANATILYACTQEGLFVFTKPGTLTEWLPPRKVLAGQMVTSVWAEPGPPTRVLVITEGDLMLSENGGRTWEPVQPLNVPTKLRALYGSGDPPSVYAAAEDGTAVVSHDGGASWSQTRADEVKSAQHGAGDKVYAVGQVGVQVSSDAGKRWETIPGSPTSARVMLALPGAAGKPPAIIVGTPSGLVVSPDGGATWNSVDLPASGAVSALVRDPERRDRLYAATADGHLLESGDRAHTWHMINATPLPLVSYLYAIRI